MMKITIHIEIKITVKINITQAKLILRDPKESSKNSRKSKRNIHKQKSLKIENKIQLIL